MHACFLLQRGLKTLPLRVRQQSANALALAQFLEKQPQVSLISPSQHHSWLSPWLSGSAAVMSLHCTVFVRQASNCLLLSCLLGSISISGSTLNALCCA